MVDKVLETRFKKYFVLNCGNTSTGHVLIGGTSTSYLDISYSRKFILRKDTCIYFFGRQLILAISQIGESTTYTKIIKQKTIVSETNERYGFVAAVSQFYLCLATTRRDGRRGGISAELS